jgi:hypothetical protein
MRETQATSCHSNGRTPIDQATRLQSLPSTEPEVEDTLSGDGMAIKQLETLDLFSTIDFVENYDYKANR